MSASDYRVMLQAMKFMPMAFIQYLQAGADAMTPEARQQVMNKFKRANTLAVAAVNNGAKRIAGLAKAA